VRYLFFDQLKLAVGPGVAYTFSTSNAFNNRVGFGGIAQAAIEFLQAKDWALDFHIQGFPQVYNTADGGLSIIAAAGIEMSWF
jgi:hypothetical protein